MKIEIKGIDFSNKGAELMLHSIIDALDRYVKDYELVLTPGFLLPYQKRAKLGAWQKFSFTKFGFDWTALGNYLPAAMVNQLRHFGIVVEKEIDLVLDASGFVYSDQWDAPKLKQTATHLGRLKNGCRYVFLPQAFGPFNKPKNKALMAELIDRSDLVVARDDYSFNALNEVKSSDKILNFPDFTPLLDAADAQLPEDLPQRFAAIVPNSKMYPKHDKERRQAYIDFLKNAVSVIQSLGLSPVLVNHEGGKDAQLCRDLLSQLSTKPRFYDGLDVLVVKKLLGNSVFNLSSRFHGCVSGLSQGVPTLATSWSHKYEQLYRFYQCPEHVIKVDSQVDELEHKMTQLLEQLEQLEQLEPLQQQLQDRAAQHKAMVEKMWTLILSKL